MSILNQLKYHFLGGISLNASSFSSWDMCKVPLNSTSLKETECSGNKPLHSHPIRFKIKKKKTCFILRKWLSKRLQVVPLSVHI